MRSFDVHVPCSLIESPFPDWIKIVWMRIRGYQGQNEWASCFLKTVAQDIDKDPGNVSVAVQVLEKFGWIERNGRKIRCKTGASTEEEIREYLPVFMPSKKVANVIEIVCDTTGIGQDTTEVDANTIGLSPIIVGLSPTSIGEDTTGIGLSPIRTESQQLKPTVKANNNKENGDSCDSPSTQQDSSDDSLQYEVGSWQRKYARAALNQFQERDALSNAIHRQIKSEGREYVLQQWADTLRLCVEQDGYSQEEIRQILRWLFKSDDFWIGRGLRSLGAIRNKKSGDTERKIDKIHGQWKSATNGQTQHTRQSNQKQSGGNGRTPRKSARERANQLSAESIRESTERSRQILQRIREGGAWPQRSDTNGG